MKSWLRVALGVVAAVILILSVILILVFVPTDLNRSSRRFAHETGALRATRTLHTAQVQYSSQYGCFAKSLAELGPPAGGRQSAAAADLIGKDLASGERNGYRFTLTGACRSYQITAVPIAFGVTGSRTFFSDQTMIVRENDGPEPATVNSRELNAR
jgi:type IV pilus assembly protein PilA